MHICDIFTDAFGRIRDEVVAVASGLDHDDLLWRPQPQTNSIAWLLWHLSRVQDDHVAAVAGTAQRWNDDGWYERFGLPFDRAATGYGFSSSDVDAVRVDNARLLVDYHEAVTSATIAWIATLDDAAYERVVDHWHGEPVTLAVRLVSVVDDSAQHAGQAAYVRGMLPN